MMIMDITKQELDYYKSLGIYDDSKYFRNHYKNGRLNNIDEKYVRDIQDYFKTYFRSEICPVTHLAYTHVTGEKNIKIFPQYMFRQEFLPVFNDNLQTDIYLDKSLYDTMFNTKNQAYNVIKRIRGKYYNHENDPISFEHVLSILINDSPEYIIKPSDTNNGLGIRKMKVSNNKLLITNEEVNENYLNNIYGYN